MKYKIKKNQIKAILGYQIDLAQMKLEDGITIVEAEKFEPEYSVGIVTAEGVIPMPVGEYKLEEGKVVVKVDPKYYRPTEVDLLIGDPAKAMTKLGWKPKYDLAALVKEMVASDITLFKKELHIKQSGL